MTMCILAGNGTAHWLAATNQWANRPFVAPPGMEDNALRKTFW